MLHVLVRFCFKVRLLYLNSTSNYSLLKISSECLVEEESSSELSFKQKIEPLKTKVGNIFQIFV